MTSDAGYDEPPAHVGQQREMSWGSPKSTDRFAFRPLLPRDYPLLYEWAVMNEGAYRWRFRDIRPSFEDFCQTLYNGVLAQFLIVNKESGAPAGLVVAYQANFKNRNAYIALQGAPNMQNRGWLLDGAWLFIDWLFDAFGFEKLYAEAPEFNIASFRSGIGRVVVQEGRLARHIFAGGRWWDMFILAIHKEAWAGAESPVARSRSLIKLDAEESGLDFDGLMSVLTGQLAIDLQEFTESASLVEEVGLDSVALLEMLVALEELGSRVPFDAIADMNTLGDVHFAYLQHRASPSVPSGQPDRL